MNRFSPLPLALLVFTACYDSPNGPPPPAGTERATKSKHDVEVKSVWEEESLTAGKQHIAILDDDAYTHSDHFLVFGEKNGKLSTRDFVGEFSIFVNPGNVETARDNFYQFTAKFLTKDIMEVTLEGQDGSKIELVYRKIDNEKLVNEAIATADKFYEKFDKLVASKVQKLTDLKALIRLHQRTHDFGPNFEKGLEWQFVLEDLQIEGFLELSSPNKKLAGVEIKANGSDAISKHFKKKFGMDWTLNVPSADEALANHDPEADFPTFLTFEKGIKGVEKGPIRDGLKKFAKFTVMLSEPAECEDFFFEDHDFFWVLEDGSILSYTTTPECD